MVIQFFPVVRGYAVDEKIWVISRVGDQRQNATCRWVDRNQRPLTLTKGLFSDLLQLDIKAQGKIVAGNWRNAFQAAQGATASIDFNFFIAGFAVELKLVMLLQPIFPDMVCALVVRLLLHLFNPAQIAVSDPTDVANGM